MEIIVTETYEEMSIRGAEIVSDLIKEKTSSGSQCTLGLATGSTPLGLYRNLIRMNRSGVIDFSVVRTFNLDEYLGLDPSDERSYHSFMRKHLFDHINIRAENIHIPEGCSPDPLKTCRKYEETIREAGGVDLQLLGMGGNGHIGFNEPGSGFDSLTRVVELAPRTIEDNSRFFDSPEEVPEKAVTMGISTILRARRILFLVNGEAKARALSEALYGPVTEELPASALRNHPRVTLICDRRAMPGVR